MASIIFAENCYDDVVLQLLFYQSFVSEKKRKFLTFEID